MSVCRSCLVSSGGSDIAKLVMAACKTAVKHWSEPKVRRACVSVFVDKCWGV